MSSPTKLKAERARTRTKLDIAKYSYLPLLPCALLLCLWPLAVSLFLTVPLANMGLPSWSTDIPPIDGIEPFCSSRCAHYLNQGGQGKTRVLTPLVTKVTWLVCCFSLWVLSNTQWRHELVDEIFIASMLYVMKFDTDPPWQNQWKYLL